MRLVLGGVELLAMRRLLIVRNDLRNFNALTRASWVMHLWLQHSAGRLDIPGQDHRGYARK